MRMIVALEGVKRLDGRTIQPGALTMLRDEVPVVWMDKYDKPHGKASDLQREDNVLTMEIEMFDYAEVLSDLDAYVFASDLVEKDKDVSYGTIRCVSLCAKQLNKPRTE